MVPKATEKTKPPNIQYITFWRVSDDERKVFDPKTDANVAAFLVTQAATRRV